MLIEISYGEALDRLSILEIKMSQIQDTKKLMEIQKEIDSLSELSLVKSKLFYYYTLLLDVNKKIWDFTNTIKSMVPTDSEFAPIANTIFDLNQSRFRLKCVVNKISESRIQEQKSYGLTQINVHLEEKDKPTLLNTLSSLSLEYDIVNITCDESMKEHILSTVPTFNYTFLAVK